MDTQVGKILPEADAVGEIVLGNEWLLVLYVILVCIVFGGIGGLAAFFVRGQESEPEPSLHQEGEEKLQTQSDSPVEASPLSEGASAVGVYSSINWWQSFFIGAASAIGFLFFTIAVGGLAGQFATLTEILRTVSTSVIAGFGAQRLLPLMVGQLEKKIDALDKQTAAAQQRAAAAEKRAEHADIQNDRLEVNINLKDASTPTALDGFRLKAIEAAEKFLKTGEATSGTWVNLARAYRWNKRREKAISTLDDAIDLMVSGKIDQDSLAAAYYNRGCYRAILHNDNTSAEEIEKAMSDLEAFFATTKNPKDEAKIINQDKDWEKFADDPRFKEIVGKWSG